MENQTKVKVFCKTLTNQKYHLASFNAPISKDSQLPRHIIEEPDQDDKAKVYADVKQMHQNAERGQPAGDEAPSTILQNRKNAKLRYVYEEVRQDDQEPTKFLGYEDPQYASGPGGNANYALMIYDKKHNVFKIVPVDKHYKFEKKLEIKKKEPVRGEKPVETEELGEKKRIMPKASKIEAKRQQLNRILSEQKKSAINTRFKAVHEIKPKPTENDPDAAINHKKKKKGLTEKELDYEEVVDDDNDEDQVAIESQHEEEDENELSEDGKAFKARFDVAEKEEAKPLDLNYQEEMQHIPGEGNGQEDIEDNSSSMASSLFYDDEEDPSKDIDIQDIGAKRTATSAGLASGDKGFRSGEKKRRRE